MKAVEEHVAHILQAVRPLAPLNLDLLEAKGGILTEDVTAPVSLPPLDSAATDGYAVRTADLAEASEESPVLLSVIEEISVGDEGIHAIGPGLCARIVTGAPMPAGADAVVPVEWTDGGTIKVAVRRSPDPGQYVRRAGEEVAAGQVVLAAGTRLHARHLGLAAAVGRASVPVRPHPRVVIIATGAELVPTGRPLGPAQIWDANSYLLTAAAMETGCVTYRLGIVPDDADELRTQITDQLVRADAIITSGGAGLGTHQPVKEALSGLGTVRFDKVAMQPGMPQGFGVVGEEQVPVFALPANPVSAYVSFLVFVRPALRKLHGLDAKPLPTVPATATEPLRSPAGKRSYLRAKLSRAEDGTWQVAPARGQGSHQLTALAVANALAVVEEPVTEVAAGDQVEVIRL